MVETEGTDSGMVTTSGVWTTDTTSAGYSFYCKATWDSQEVKSAAVYLGVMGFTSNQATQVWGVEGNIVIMTALTDGYLKAEGGFYKDANKAKVQADIGVQWQIKESGSWIDISGAKYTAGAQPHSLSTAGERKSPLTIITLAQADNDKAFRAKITYTANSGENFSGGEVIGEEITLKISYITDLSINDPMIITGETVTLSCVVDGEDEPTFTFSTGISKKNVDKIRFEEVSQATTTVGNTHTARYVMKTLKPYINGPEFKCTALFAGTTAKGPTEKALNITVYYNCETKTVQGANSLTAGGNYLILKFLNKEHLFS